LSLPRTPKVRMRTVKLHSKTTLLSSVLTVAMLIAALAVTSAAIANIERTDDQTLAETQARDVPFAFDRKEAKTHGEGGLLIGAPMKGRVLIVDDVITAGTAIRQSLELIRAQGATAAGVLIALDRQERGQGTQSAVQEVSAQFGLRCVSILTLADLIETFAQASGDAVRISREQFVALQSYQREWGIGAVSGGAKAGAE